MVIDAFDIYEIRILPWRLDLYIGPSHAYLKPLVRACVKHVVEAVVCQCSRQQEITVIYDYKQELIYSH